jgi:hypothetical protein
MKKLLLLLTLTAAMPALKCEEDDKVVRPATPEQITLQKYMWAVVGMGMAYNIYQLTQRQNQLEQVVVAAADIATAQDAAIL